MDSPWLRFPVGFLWGTATSSHQVEDCNENNDWWEWEQQPGRIAGGHRSGAACEWWAGRAEEDLSRAAASGQNAHRLSLEWSRLEPEPGRYDDEAFARYRRLLEHVRAIGMTPMVTLQHFTLPRWQSARGGWSDRGILPRFEALAGECARRLGDLVPLWCTINEPFNIAYYGYLTGRWPPGGPLLKAFGVVRNLFAGHALAYHAIRQASPGAQVGLAYIMQRFLPASPKSRLDRLAAGVQDLTSVESWLRPLRTGRLSFPWSLGERVPGLAGAVDFLGVNYYGTYQVRFDPTNMTLGRWVQTDSIRHGPQDWGTPDPEGLYHALLRGTKLGVPVYVTENGVCDPDDRLRPGHLVRHLDMVHAAISDGLDVRGYFHWSLLDNFEWAEGWETKFGLIEVDPATQERRERSSFELYGRIALANGIGPAELSTIEEPKTRRRTD